MANYQRKWPTERILHALKEYFAFAGAVPTAREYPDIRYTWVQPMPSFATLKRSFGQYSAAWIAAGVKTRHHFPWSEAEDDFLKERVGTMTLRTLARRLNRTESAVKFRMHQLCIGQMSNDGRYTASELSRELGVSVYIVIKRAKSGEYHGQKLQGVWRIDYPDDSSELG